MTDRRPARVDGDDSARIIDALRQASASRRAVYVSAGGSKRDLIGRPCHADRLDVSSHRGIVDYQPGELVLTARAGTPLADITAALDDQRQVLPFEPPLFDGRATLGGTLASNINGPARPWCGSIRDAVLGVQLLNGRCERLNFGGKVMKNVAGFDVSRLQAGALGTLGVLSEVSLKVLPRPQKTLTLCYAMTASTAISWMNRRAGESKPLSGAAWLDGQLYLRLSGADRAVDSAAAQWGGDTLTGAADFWQGLREMTLPFFAGHAPLWRLSMPSTAPVAEHLGPTLVDWCGALRWVRADCAREAIEASAAGGHVTLFRGGDRRGEVCAPLGAAHRRLHQRLKHAFDPDGILNPGRLYSWL